MDSVQRRQVRIYEIHDVYEIVYARAIPSGIVVPKDLQLCAMSHCRLYACQEAVDRHRLLAQTARWVRPGGVEIVQHSDAPERI